LYRSGVGMNRVISVAAMCLIMIGAGLAGCETRFPPAASALRSVATFGEELAPIKLDRVSYNFRRGQQIGNYRDAADCADSGKITWSGGTLTGSDQELEEIFFHELKNANYNVLGDPQQMFSDYSDDAVDPEYLVGARIESLNLDLCDQYNAWGEYKYGTQIGTGRMSVTWLIFSTLERAVVLETKSEGHGVVSQGVPEGDVAVIVESFASAAANLAADPKFHALLASGRGGTGGNGNSNKTSRAPVDDPLLAVSRAAGFTGDIAANIHRIEESVVTVIVPGGHGSGFFIGPNLILTNHHVAGGSKQVKIRLIDGWEMYANVLRSHPGRDVALLQIEGGSFASLPVRTGALALTEEVYAIGSPMDESLAGTVTRGIVSQKQVDERGFELIQADVEIQPGSSGGPLLDKNGNVVGISVAGIPSGEALVGINFFIPIADALYMLNVSLR
jgi:serine protease Do